MKSGLRRLYPFNAEQTVNVMSEFGPLITMFIVNAAYGITVGTYALLITTVVAIVVMRIVLKRLPAKRKASGAGFGSVFLWSLLASLCMVLFAGPAAANASNASIVFSGYVPERGQGSFHVEQEQLVAFGATGGVRLHAANPTRSAARLTYVVLDGSDNIIAGGQGRGLGIR